MGRPPIRKKGAFNNTEHVRRYRARLKRNNPDPKTIAKQARRAGGYSLAFGGFKLMGWAPR
jgi:hypothetical protein